MDTIIYDTRNVLTAELRSSEYRAQTEIFPSNIYCEEISSNKWQL